MAHRLLSNDFPSPFITEALHLKQITIFICVIRFILLSLSLLVSFQLLSISTGKIDTDSPIDSISVSEVKFDFENPDPYRYGFTSNYWPIPKKRLYFTSKYSLSAGFRYGINDYLTVSAVTPMPQIYVLQWLFLRGYVSPLLGISSKLTVPITDWWHVGVSINLFGGVVFAPVESAALFGGDLYNVGMTLGDLDRNVTVGFHTMGLLGKYYDITEDRMFSLHGMYRVSNAITLVSENFFDYYETSAVSVGVRYNFPKIAIDGLVYGIIVDGDFSPVPLPIISISAQLN